MNELRFIRYARHTAGADAVGARHSGYSPWRLAALGIIGAAVLMTFGDAITFMVGQWDMEEFSHGYLIPFISAYLVWQRRQALRSCAVQASWTGLTVVLAGALLEIAGKLSALWTLQHVALLVVIVGLVLALWGWQVLRVLAVPLGVLWFMIPLPNILLNTLSAHLQLISSSVGAWLIRAAGVSVYLEGNIIDLGTYKLEVAQACSGLRYLLPLMTLAFLVACLYRAELWKRVIIFLSSIPITLIMNSLRVASIGVMVDRWGPGMAEGFLHAAQGWTMFMLSVGVLVLELMLFTRLDSSGRSLRDLLDPHIEARAVQSTARASSASRSGPFVASGLLVLGLLLACLALPKTAEATPKRDAFISFPLQIGDWSGKRAAMDQDALEVLKLDDYLLADYRSGDSRLINLYVAWYDSQRAGASTHSPKACLPGAGWVIQDFREVSIDRVHLGSQTLRVNRALMENHDQRELVYYWFQQRGRVVTNELLVKWYLLLDAVTRHRTDGALVRVIIPVSGAASIAEADQQLQEFLAAIAPRLDRFVPG